MTRQGTSRLPTLFIPHGGGPCFFMDWTMGPPDTWERTFRDVRTLLVISGHWEERVVTVQSGARPPLLFDYYGFPPETYELTWPAPGAPAVAARARALLEAAGIPSSEDPDRGLDHGVFIPLKVALPEAKIPIVQLSLNASLDTAAHVAIGQALAPLREDGVLIVGSGMSFHNMGAMMRPGSALEASREFDAWLGAVCEGEPAARGPALARWSEVPRARDCHPREEHLLPLMVAAGAAGDERGRRIFRDQVMGAEVSAFQFGL